MEAPELFELRLDFEGALAASLQRAERLRGHPDGARSLLGAAELAEALDGCAAGSRAAAIWERLAALAPADARAAGFRLRAGRCDEEAGRLDRAAQSFAGVLHRQQAPRATRDERAAARLGLIRVRFSQGRIREALALLEDPASLSGPRAVEARCLRARIRAAGLDWGYAGLEQERIAARLRAFQRSMEELGEAVGAEEPDDRDAFEARCEAALALGELHARFGRWLIGHPRPHALSGEMQELYEAEIESRALDFFEQAAAIDGALVARVAAAHRGARFGHRAREALWAIRAWVDTPPAWYRLRWPALAAEGGSPALSAARERLIADPGDPQARLGAAEALAQSAPGLALYFLQRHAAASPQRALVQARALAALGRHAEAYELLRDLLARSPRLLAAWRQMADSCFVFGDLVCARRALDELRADAKGDARLLLPTAAALYGLGQEERAQALLERVAPSDASWALARFDLGLILWDGLRRSRARHTAEGDLARLRKARTCLAAALRAADPRIAAEARALHARVDEQVQALLVAIEAERDLQRRAGQAQDLESRQQGI
ncbi:MAG: hypothetical protein JXR96_12000 [Deltaproteobacteria bacterium]|nr:hypothetical protein [Deltaproteobacteria bacterium]